MVSGPHVILRDRAHPDEMLRGEGGEEMRDCRNLAAPGQRVRVRKNALQAAVGHLVKRRATGKRPVALPPLPHFFFSDGDDVDEEAHSAGSGSGSDNASASRRKNQSYGQTLSGDDATESGGASDEGGGGTTDATSK